MLCLNYVNYCKSLLFIITFLNNIRRYILMQKRKIKQICAVALTVPMLLATSLTSFADSDLSADISADIANSQLRAGGGWYYSTITLPRNGNWFTTARKATVVNNGTGVSNPTYKVQACIANSSGSILTGWQDHPAKSDSVRWHKTDRKGSMIKGVFRSAPANQTNK
jgi:hypothetical protein